MRCNMNVAQLYLQVRVDCYPNRLFQLDIFRLHFFRGKCWDIDQSNSLYKYNNIWLVHLLTSFQGIYFSRINPLLCKLYKPLFFLRCLNTKSRLKITVFLVLENYLDWITIDVEYIHFFPLSIFSPFFLSFTFVLYTILVIIKHTFKIRSISCFTLSNWLQR